MGRQSLTAIADEEGTDKGTLGPTDDWRGHNYTDIYDAYLHPMRDRAVTILEIGLGVDGPGWRAHIAKGRNAAGGGSLRTWYRYFPKARILGIDINPAGFLDNDRIVTGVVDQGDPEQLRAFLAEHDVSQLDVIIDDGSHRPDHQQISLSTLFSRLAPSGLYFIEDLMANGIGDGKEDRYASPDILNTRSVLRGFMDNGEFSGPNALIDPAALSTAIESVAFHCPAVKHGGKVGRRPSILNGRQAPPRFVAGSEEMCVLRMTPDPHADGVV
jgi:hypothetical protein